MVASLNAAESVLTVANKNQKQKFTSRHLMARMVTVVATWQFPG